MLTATVTVASDPGLFIRSSDTPGEVGWAGRSAAAGIVVAGVVTVPVLIFRRRAPTLVCVFLAAHALVVTALFGSRPRVSLLVALYAAAVYTSRRRALTCLFAILAAHGLAVVYEAPFRGSTTFSVAAVRFVIVLLDVAT